MSLKQRKPPVPVPLQAAAASKSTVVSTSKSVAPVLPAFALFRWTHAIESLCVFVVALTILALTAYPTVSGGDAGELIVTACNLAVAHPPGYPTFSMLSALFVRLLPWGTPAWRVNMATATLTAVAAAALYWTARLFTNSRTASLAASIGFLCSPTVWTYAGQGEVFGLNNSLHALLCLATAAFGATRSAAMACWAAFLCGLLATNQHTSIFTILPTALGVLLHGGPSRMLRPRVLIPILVSAFLGLVPYVYLPWASSRSAMDGWGETASLSGFLRHFLRQEYGTFQLAADVTDTVGIWGRLKVYLIHLLAESLYVTVPLALLGLACTWFASGITHQHLSVTTGDKKSKSLLRYAPFFDFKLRASTEPSGGVTEEDAVVTMVEDSENRSMVQKRMLRFCGLVFATCYFSYVFFFHYLANLDLSPLFLGVQARFWQQANLYVFLFAAIGFDAVRVYVCRSTLGSRARPLFGMFALAFVVAQVYLNWSYNDHHNHWAVSTYGRTILDAMPRNAIILINGDINNNAVKYMHQCEHVRRDVSVLSLQLMSWEWFVPVQGRNYPAVKFPAQRYHPHQPDGFSISAFLDANYASAPIFLCGPWKDGDESWRRDYTTAVFGLCDRVLRQKDAAALDWTDHLQAARAAVPSSLQLGNWSAAVYGAETWEHVVFTDSWQRSVHHASLAAYHASQLAETSPKRRKLLRLAVSIFDELLGDANPVAPIPVSEFRTAGVIYGTYSKMCKKAEVEHKYSTKMLEAWGRFVELSPSSDAQRTEIEPLVKQRYNPYLGRIVQSK